MLDVCVEGRSSAAATVSTAGVGFGVVKAARAHSKGNGRVGGRDGNPRGFAGDAPISGQSLKPSADGDGAGHLL